MNAIIERELEYRTFQGTSESRGLLTDDLVVGEAHDVHCIQCLLEIILVLLARDGNVTI